MDADARSGFVAGPGDGPAAASRRRSFGSTTTGDRSGVDGQHRAAGRTPRAGRSGWQLRGGVRRDEPAGNPGDRFRGDRRRHVDGQPRRDRDDRVVHRRAGAADFGDRLPFTAAGCRAAGLHRVGGHGRDRVGRFAGIGFGGRLDRAGSVADLYHQPGVCFCHPFWCRHGLLSVFNRPAAGKSPNASLGGGVPVIAAGRRWGADRFGVDDDLWAFDARDRRFWQICAYRADDRGLPGGGPGGLPDAHPGVVAQYSDRGCFGPPRSSRHTTAGRR